MKISSVKNKKILNWVLTVLVCLLLASWGVNGTINPMSYVKKADKTSLQVEEKEEYTVITLAENVTAKGYLNVEVDEITPFMADIDVLYNYESKSQIKGKLSLGEGRNEIKISKLGESVENIAISHKKMTEEGIILGEIYYTEYRQTNIWTMLKIFASFVSLTVFWSMMQWIKNRYAK